MVVAYSPEGKHAAQFEQANRKKDGSWLTLLTQKDVLFGRTDPYVDPKGQNIVFSLMLAEKYYNMPGITDKILGSLQTHSRLIRKEGCWRVWKAVRWMQQRDTRVKFTQRICRMSRCRMK